jgi:hypothetical protein
VVQQIFIVATSPSAIGEVRIRAIADKKDAHADETWWAYEPEPNQQRSGWYENEVGRPQPQCATPVPNNRQNRLIRQTVE